MEFALAVYGLLTLDRKPVVFQVTGTDCGFDPGHVCLKNHFNGRSKEYLNPVHADRQKHWNHWNRLRCTLCLFW